MSAREGPLLVAELIIAIGLIVAWKWEGLGSLLILGGTAFLAIVNYGVHFMVFGPLLLMGFLFLCCWWRTPKRTGGREAVAGIVLLMLLVGGAVVLNALRERVLGRDCERVITWVRSSHSAPGTHSDLALPSQFQGFSADGKVDAVVLADGRVVLLLKTWVGWKDNWSGIIYSSSPLKPSEISKDYYGRPRIWISDTPQGPSILEDHFIEAKVNDRLYFVAFDLG